jgi:uncharacterized repeat protein (TIGR03847 family)
VGAIPTLVHAFDWPDGVVVGTVGLPGSRTFSLQAREGSRTAAVVLEKEQSAVLAEAIDRVLDELMDDSDNTWSGVERRDDLVVVAACLAVAQELHTLDQHLARLRLGAQQLDDLADELVERHRERALALTGHEVGRDRRGHDLGRADARVGELQAQRLAEHVDRRAASPRRRSDCSGCSGRRPSRP